MSKVSKAFEQVFGGVNVSASSRSAVHNGGTHKEMRVGKTAKDKANGHIAGKKNRRVWDDGGWRFAGQWKKV